MRNILKIFNEKQNQLDKMFRYCETLNSCVDPLAWNCSVPCGPGLTICSEGSTQTCSPPGSSCTGSTYVMTKLKGIYTSFKVTYFPIKI